MGDALLDGDVAAHHEDAGVAGVGDSQSLEVPVVRTNLEPSARVVHRQRAEIKDRLGSWLREYLHDSVGRCRLLRPELLRHFVLVGSVHHPNRATGRVAADTYRTKLVAGSFLDFRIGVAVVPAETEQRSILRAGAGVVVAGR